MIKTGLKNVRLIYVDGLYEKSCAPGGTPKYNVTILVKKDSDAYHKLKEAYEQAVTEGLKDWGKKPSTITFESSFLDATDKFDNDWAEGHVMLRPKSDYQPGIFGTEKEANGTFKLLEGKAYNGALANVVINVYGYTNKQGGKGISSFINAVQVLPGGEEIHLSSQADFTSDFDSLMDDISKQFEGI